MALTRTPPLDERIKNVCADANAAIDALTDAEIKRTGGGVPFESIRTSLTGGIECTCRAYLAIKAREEAQRAA
jgi:hypothetical protein